MRLFVTTPETEIKHRISTVRQFMAGQGIPGLFFTHKPDIFYFSGTAQDCYLFVSQDHDPLLFVRRHLPRALEETPLRNVIHISSVRDIPVKIRELNGGVPAVCGLAFDVVPHRDFLFYQQLFSGVRFDDATHIINRCRQIKSAWEMDRMQKAAVLSKQIFDYIAETIEPGVSEMAFCGRFETYARQYGHSGKLLMRHYRAEGFPFHLLSGKSGGLPGALDSPVCGTGTSCAYPYGAGPKLLERDEPILIDFGTVLDGYHIDETRMFVMGRMPQKAMDACKAMIEVLYGAKERMRPGVAMAELYDSCVAHAQKLGLGREFLGLPGQKAKFIGHGVGLELVEAPVVARGSTDELLPGMVLAMEPKCIFQDQYAAGIESMIRITKTAAEFLSVTENRVFEC